MNRGAVYVFLKQDDAAEKDFRKAVETDPHSLAAYANLAGYYLYKKDAKKAEEIYRDEMANNPDSPVPYLRLAGLLLREGRKDEGEAIVQQLRTKQPSSADVASAIGDFYLAGAQYRRRSEGISARLVLRSQEPDAAGARAGDHDQLRPE